MRLASCIAAVFATLAVAGCGQTSFRSDSSFAAGPTNPHVFSVDLNALCKAFNGIVRGPVVKTLASRERRLLRKLKELRPPPVLAPVYARFLKNDETVARHLRSGNLRAAILASRANRPLLAKLNASACRIP